ncbi:hypothetical protein Cni_G12231 [Canna indica]|uniref:Transcription repressor n=1 Tax=Canna indica TaxID=4628 RepID=A0AAQ3QBL6_9LILI|nr:hypothetical protein Cni_G12231 [Canna indica]
MSSSNHRKLRLRHQVVVDIGCNCRKPKLSSLFPSFSSSNATKHKPAGPFSSTTTSSSTACDSPPRNRSVEETNYSPLPADAAKRKRKKNKEGRVARESLVVVKETSEPYSDFKESMVQMIVEKEIYGWDDLNDLLHQFLTLNSPRHHHVILRAFADLWSGVFSPPSPLAGGGAAYPL